MSKHGEYNKLVNRYICGKATEQQIARMIELAEQMIKEQS